MARIERVSYRRGFVESLEEVGCLPAITIAAPDLPADVLAVLEDHFLDLGGTYGVPEAGGPIQSDELRIEHDQGEVEIVVYNPPSCCSRPTTRGEADSPGMLAVVSMGSASV